MRAMRDEGHEKCKYDQNLHAALVITPAFSQLVYLFVPSLCKYYSLDSI